MSSITKIFIPVFPHSSLVRVRALVREASRIAGWLGATSTFVVPENDLSRLSREFEGRSMIPVSGSFIPGALKTLPGDDDSALLLVTEARGPFRAKQALGGSAMSLLEASALPAFVLPWKIRLQAQPPVRSVLVPVSGERAQSRALELGIRIGNRSGVPVDVLHVTSGAPGERDRSVLGRASDEFHLEYPQAQETFIAAASPYSTSEERLAVRNICHCVGEVDEELKKQIKARHGRKHHVLLLFGWKGSLRAGRARTIKLLLHELRDPLLLVREESLPRTQLRVGERFGCTCGCRTGECTCPGTRGLQSA